jgi:hypothetical protein
MIKKLGVALACICLAGPASAGERVHEGYKGTDAGVLIFSSGSIGEESNFKLFYRKVGAPSGYRGFGGDGSIDYDTTSLFGSSPADFKGHEEGQVKTIRLEPGSYEVYSYEIYAAGGAGSTLTWGPHKDFSIPFTIDAGKATYIGDFAGIRLTAKGFFGAKVTAGGLIVVKDEQARDIPIAQKQVPDLPPVTVSVTDVSRLGEPTLLAKEPAS